MTLIKFIAVGITLIAISKSYLDFRKRRESQTMFIFWTIVWVGAISIVLHPPLIDALIAYTKDKSITISSLTALGFIFLLYIVYRVYSKAARIEYQQTELIRKLGLKKAEKK